MNGNGKASNELWEWGALRRKPLPPLNKLSLREIFKPLKNFVLFSLLLWEFVHDEIYNLHFQKLGGEIC